MFVEHLWEKTLLIVDKKSWLQAHILIKRWCWQSKQWQKHTKNAKHYMDSLVFQGSEALDVQNYLPLYSELLENHFCRELLSASPGRMGWWSKPWWQTGADRGPQERIRTWRKSSGHRRKSKSESKLRYISEPGLRQDTKRPSQLHRGGKQSGRQRKYRKM